MVIIGIIMLEAAAFILLLWAFIFFDERLAAWEHRAWKRVKRAALRLVKSLIRRLDKIEERIRWRTRKIRREICVRLLAKDGVTIPECTAPENDLEATFLEVMRLLEK